jgi:hypothetical protein
MQARNRRFPAPPRGNTLRPALWLLVVLFSVPLMSFLGCAGGSPNYRQFFGSTPAAAPSEQATYTDTATPSATPTAAQSSSQSRSHKKSSKDAHLAVEKASEASESAAEASAKAQQASKQARQAADAASRAETAGDNSSGKSIVSLEANPAPSAGSTPGAADTIAAVSGSTPAARPTLSLESGATPTASGPAIATAAEPSPTDAAKLIADVDKTEKRIDRKNFTSDEAQRDILAQRLLQGAKKALADHDNVAAISLATKASTLLAPLPKIPSPANSTMR